MPMVDKLNETPIAAELLGGAMEAVAELPPEDRRDMTTQMLCIIEHVEKTTKGKAEAGVGAALYFRMLALGKLTSDYPLPGFASPDFNGAKLLHPDVIRCAAEQPLIMIGEDVAFDAGAFQIRLLDIAEAAGSA